MARQDRTTEPQRPRKSRGLRFTEGLLPVFGPAQVSDPTKPSRPDTDAERQRETDLRTQLVRVTAPDGSTYVVERPINHTPEESK